MCSMIFGRQKNVELVEEKLWMEIMHRKKHIYITTMNKPNKKLSIYGTINMCRPSRVVMIRCKYTKEHSFPYV